MGRAPRAAGVAFSYIHNVQLSERARTATRTRSESVIAGSPSSSAAESGPMVGALGSVIAGSDAVLPLDSVVVGGDAAPTIVGPAPSSSPIVLGGLAISLNDGNLPSVSFRVGNRQDTVIAGSSQALVLQSVSAGSHESPIFPCLASGVVGCDADPTNVGPAPPCFPNDIGGLAVSESGISPANTVFVSGSIDSEIAGSSLYVSGSNDSVSSGSSLAIEQREMPIFPRYDSGAGSVIAGPPDVIVISSDRECESFDRPSR